MTRGRAPARARAAGALCPLLLTLLLCTACASQRRPAATRRETPAQATPRYALLIDAGSSGSRIHIFAWRPAPAGGGLPWIVAAPSPREDVWEAAVEPGLSAYVDDPAAAGPSLAPLLAYAAEKIGGEAETLGRTLLYLKATGGLRRLDPVQRQAIRRSVVDYLATTPFDFRGAEVISGQEEGLFGWIAVNYALGLLGRGAPFPTVGALDLGGASAQITFLPLDFPAAAGTVLDLGGTTYRLYSQSYSGLGQDEVRRSLDAPACYPRGYPLDDGERVGTGDFIACRALIRRFLEQPCRASRCSLMGLYQPPLYGDFLALSVYAYTAAFLGLDPNLSLPALEAAGAEYCATDWQVTLRRRPDAASRAHLPNYCFSAAYVLTLLTEGFGFPLATDRITTPFRVQGYELSWALGALVYELARAD